MKLRHDVCLMFGLLTGCQTAGMAATGGSGGEGGSELAGGAGGNDSAALGVGGVASGEGGAAGSVEAGVSGGSPGTAGAGGASPAASAGGSASAGGASATAANNGDTAKWNFESGAQGWRDYGPNLDPPASKPGLTLQDPVTVSKPVWKGLAALEYRYQPTGVTKEEEKRMHYVGIPGASAIGPLTPGKAITGRVFLPAGHKITNIAFVLIGPGIGEWNAVYQARSQWTDETWLTFKMPVPASFAGTGKRASFLGFQFANKWDLGWDGKVYIDSVDIEP